MKTCLGKISLVVSDSSFHFIPELNPVIQSLKLWCEFVKWAELLL